MIVTGRMVYLTAVTLQEYSRSMSAELLRLGMMHFVDIRTIEPAFESDKNVGVRGNESEIQQSVLTAARRRIESILNIGGIPRPTVGRDGVGRNNLVGQDEAREMAESFESRIESIREKQSTLQQQINRLDDVRRHIVRGEGNRIPDGGGLGGGGTFLHLHTGSLPEDRLESLEQKIALYPAVISRSGRSGSREFIVLVGMNRNKADLEKILSDHGFTPRDFPSSTPQESIPELDSRLEELKKEQRTLRSSIPDLVSADRLKLEQAWRDLRVQELQKTIESRFAETRRSVVASGWIPDHARSDVENALLKSTDGHVSLEWHEASEFIREPPGHVTIPSRLKNPRFLNPFQRLVKNYGIPVYGTIDPTFLVAPAYLAMFGLMFGDAGHGLILLLIGLAGHLWSKGRVNISPEKGGLASAIPNLSRLIIWCSGAAIIAGVLFGSYFGMQLFPPLWFSFHGVVSGQVETGPVESIFDVLKITIYFGITIISLGLVINWVNLVRQKRWLSLIFDNTGILGGIIYGTGIIMASQFATSGFRTLPDNPALIRIILACVLLLFLKTPLEGGTRNPLWWIMEWLISLLEVFSGYLANTLSFMRVAGLGIAHVTLMIAFFQIAEMASPDGMNIWGIAILILGNALVIALEGLSAGIQSLRLNYYEFFSKHFQPSGVEFKPISLEEQ